MNFSLGNLRLNNFSTSLNCLNYLTTIEANVNDDVKSDVLYSLNNGTAQSSNIFENLTSGTYTITATHTNGCSVSEQVTINNPTSLLIDTVTPTSVLCFGENTGSLTVNASGGNGTILYSVDGINFQTDAIFSILPCEVVAI